MKWITKALYVTLIISSLAGCVGRPFVGNNVEINTPLPAEAPTSSSLSVPSLIPTLGATPLNAPYLFQFESNLRRIGAPHYAPDGKLLFLPSIFGVLVLDPDTYQVARRLAVTSGFVNTITLSPQEKMLVYGNDGSLEFTELISWTNGDVLENPEFLSRLPERNIITDAKFSPKGSYIAVKNGGRNTDFWQMRDGQYLYSILSGPVDFSPDESLMVIVPNSDNKPHIELYETATGRQLRKWAGERAVFLPDGRLAVETKGAIRVYDLSDGTVTAAFSGRFAGFSSHGRLISLLYRDRVEIRQVADGKLLHTFQETYTFEGNFEDVESLELRFSPDGRSLAANAYWTFCCGGTASTLLLWQVENGALLQKFRDPAGFDFSPDGSSLAVASSNHLEIWNTLDGSIRSKLDSILIP